MIKKGLSCILRITLILAVTFSYFVTPEIAEAAAAETLGDLRREYESLVAQKMNTITKQKLPNKK